MSDDNMPEPVAWMHDGFVSTNKERVLHDEMRNRSSGFKAKPVFSLYTESQLRAALAAQAEKHAVVVNKCNSYIVDNARLAEANDALRAEVEALRCALHEIAEEWAGAECGEPVYAQEAYAIGLAKRMYLLAAAALRPNVGVEPTTEACRSGSARTTG